MQINGLLLLFFMFLIGIITILIAFNMYDSYRTDFFKVLYYYFLTSVILGFTYWITKFISGIVYNYQLLSFLKELFVFISIPLIIIKIYFLYRFAVLLKNAKNKKILLYIYFLFWFILYIILIWIEIFSNKYITYRISTLIFKIVFHFQFFLILSVIIYIFILSKSLKGEKWKYGIKIFAILFFSFSFLYYLFSLFYMYSKDFFNIMILLFLINQIIPVLYLSYFMSKNPDVLPKQDKNVDYKLLFSKLNISLREQEVFHLLIQGKSNKEIEDKLFISIHTVKAHIQNIYKKTGVKKRTHLINFTKKIL